MPIALLLILAGGFLIYLSVTGRLAALYATKGP